MNNYFTPFVTIKVNHIILILCLCFIGNYAKAQYIPLPDTNFAVWLTNNGFGRCVSGYQLDTTRSDTFSKTVMDFHPHIFKGHSLTGIKYFKNLLTINCANAILDSFPELPPNLTNYTSATLNINGIGKQRFPKLPARLISFNCASASIDSLPSLPKGLKYLTTSNNRLSYLPKLPDSLRELYIDNDSLFTLPILPAKLTSIDASNNHLVKLPSLPMNLTGLYCPDNNLNSLPTLPNTIADLDCSNNPLHHLPSHLPDSLKGLYCEYDSLFDLPILPKHLQVVFATGNLLDSIPTLPDSLIDLECEVNHIVKLPVLPASMRSIECGGNQLTILPNLPNSLQILHCDGNKLKQLPNLPLSVNEVYCRYNLLTSLPDLSQFAGYFYCSYNMSLQCLPNMGPFAGIWYDSTGVTCVPNYNFAGSPSPTTFPLCGLGNTHGCSIGWNITGTTYKDSTGNCLYDSSEKVYSNIKMLLYKHDTLEQQTYSYDLGQYEFATGIGVYDTFICSVDTSEVPYKLSCHTSDTLQNVISAVDTIKTNADFALECKSGDDGAVWNIHSINFRPSFSRLVTVSAGDMSKLFKMHCLSGVSGKVKVYIYGQVTYDSTSTGGLKPYTANNDSLIWTISDFGNINPNAFQFYLRTNSSAKIGDNVCIKANVVLSSVTDRDTSNNTLMRCFTVGNSLDPNSKQVYPTTINKEGEWLTYTIEFQNTGTAPAINIIVNDTLDKNLNFSTFQIVASSHNVYSNVFPGGFVQFNYKNIYLPDSFSDKIHSTGWVTYRVKMKTGLSYGTSIKNTAYIYFDNNNAVVTNTVTNTLTTSTFSRKVSEQTQLVNLFPNPAKDHISIGLNNCNGCVFMVEIFDIAGRPLGVLSNNVNAATMTLDISKYTPGVYFVKVSDLYGSHITKKLIVSGR